MSDLKEMLRARTEIPVSQIKLRSSQGVILLDRCVCRTIKCPARLSGGAEPPPPPAATAALALSLRRVVIAKDQLVKMTDNHKFELNIVWQVGPQGETGFLVPKQCLSV